MRRANTDDELVVLMSTAAPVARTNPYATMLVRSLDAVPGVRALTFSWRRALVEPFDVLHLHWPESRLEGRTPARALVKQLLFVSVLVRARLRGRPIVRTVHNVELPTGLSRRQRRILRLAERWTVLRIRLNDDTPLPPGASETIVHGHYRDWFAAYPPRPSVPGRFAFAGLVRRYKAVPELARAFAETAETAEPAPARASELSLHVTGHPSSTELADALAAIAALDHRITLDLRRVDDAELVAELTEAELVVLPYPEMHNSGAVLTALSLGRPVLVPENEVNRALAGEVGPGWVTTFRSPLTAVDLLSALAEVRRTARTTPQLDRREWRDSALAHVAAYRRAVDLTTSGPKVRDGSE